jgi:hypothetical protein
MPEELIEPAGLVGDTEAQQGKPKPARKPKKSEAVEQGDTEKRIVFVLQKTQSIVNECRDFVLHKAGEKFDAIDDAATISALARAGAPLEQIEE